MLVLPMTNTCHTVISSNPLVGNHLKNVENKSVMNGHVYGQRRTDGRAFSAIVCLRVFFSATCGVLLCGLVVEVMQNGVLQYRFTHAQTWNTSWTSGQGHFWLYPSHTKTQNIFVLLRKYTWSVLLWWTLQNTHCHSFHVSTSYHWVKWWPSDPRFWVSGHPYWRHGLWVDVPRLEVEGDLSWSVTVGQVVLSVGQRQNAPWLLADSLHGFWCFLRISF